LDIEGAEVMKVIIFLLFIIAVLMACFALYAGVTHNSMGEFCVSDNIQDINLCEFDYAYAAFIWFSWFIPVFFIPLIIVFIFRFLKSFLTNKVRS